MIITLLIFILAYWLGNMLIESKTEAADDRRTKKNRTFLWRALFFTCASVLLTLISHHGSPVFILLAALVLGVIQYVLNTMLTPMFKAATLRNYLLHEAMQLAFIYVVLWTFGQTGKPSWLTAQISLLLFEKNLTVDKEILIPSLCLVFVFLSSTSAQIISKFLNKYGNPIFSHGQETAAALEHLSEGTLLKKGNLRQGIAADMTVEEQIEVSSEGSPDHPLKSKESIKVQYHWYHKEEDSKGKYIGILERLLICVFVIYNIYQGLLLLGAMKTLARFKLFENKAFAEYYLIGTLLSLLIAVASGFLLRRMLFDAIWQ